MARWTSGTSTCARVTAIVGRPRHLLALADRVRCKFVVDASIMTAKYTAWFVFDVAAHTIHWTLDPTATDNSIAAADGEYRMFEVSAAQTLVVYRTYVDSGRSISQSIQNYFTRKAIPNLLQAVKKRVEIPHYGGDDLDASLLQMVRLRFLPPGDPRLLGTVDAIHKDLIRSGWLQRYSLDDGFGKPSVAFVICTFWLIEALAAAGRRDEARKVFDRIHVALSPLGLLSEDYDPMESRMWGNFPQTYSHVQMSRTCGAASERRSAEG